MSNYYKEIKMINEEKYYSVEKIAELLEVTRQTVYNWIYTGKIKYIKLGDVLRIPASAIPDGSYKNGKGETDNGNR